MGEEYYYSILHIVVHHMDDLAAILYLPLSENTFRFKSLNQSNVDELFLYLDLCFHGQ